MNDTIRTILAYLPLALFLIFAAVAVLSLTRSKRRRQR
jgi:hypothetical protein